MKRILLVLALLLCAFAADAQTVGLTIENQTVNGSSVLFDIVLRTTLPADTLFLASSDLVLNFNLANFTSPGIAKGAVGTFVLNARDGTSVAAGYRNAVATSIIANQIIININAVAFGDQGGFDDVVARIDNQASTHRLGTYTLSGITTPAGSLGLQWDTTAGDAHHTKVFSYAKVDPWDGSQFSLAAVNPSNQQLPIQLVSFNVNILSSDGVQLLWTTASEINNYGFYVQRSADAKTFTTLPGSFQPGHGTTIEHHDYSYTDATAGDVQYFYRLEQVDRDGTKTYSEAKEAGGTTGVKEQKPTEFALQQNYPNPFNPTSVIEYSLPSTSHVLLELYNLLGQKIATLVNDVKAPGFYQVQVDGAHLASGVYIYRLTAGQKTFVRKMALVK